MKNKQIYLLLGLALVVMVAVVFLSGVLNFEDTTSNNTSDENTSVVLIDNNPSESTSDTISVSEAQKIASDYLSSKYPDIQGASQVAAGNPSLRGDIYYVPMLVTTDEGQHSKGTVLGYVKVNSKTGAVIGEESIPLE